MTGFWMDKAIEIEQNSTCSPTTSAIKRGKRTEDIKLCVLLVCKLKIEWWFDEPQIISGINKFDVANKNNPIFLQPKK